MRLVCELGAQHLCGLNLSLLIDRSMGNKCKPREATSELCSPQDSIFGSSLAFLVCYRPLANLRSALAAVKSTAKSLHDTHASSSHT